MHILYSVPECQNERRVSRSPEVSPVHSLDSLHREENPCFLPSRHGYPHIQNLLLSDVHYLFQQLLLAIAQQHQGKVVVASMDRSIRKKADHTAQHCIYGHLGIDEVVVAPPPWGSLLDTCRASRRFHLTNTFFTSVYATYGVKINRGFPLGNACSIDISSTQWLSTGWLRVGGR